MILDFRRARDTRETPPPRRISDAELQALRLQAELNSLSQGTKAWRDLVDALVELQDLRQEKKHGW